MVRVAKLVVVLASAFSFTMAVPAETEAGIIPWMYDAIFGPVGSLRAGGGNPMAAGYAPYSAGYAPYSMGYAPYSTGYAPFYGSYNASYYPISTAQYGSPASGCSTCNQASYSVPSTGYESSYGSTGCGTCGSGNCSSGTGCSNCSVNSGSSTSGYGSTGVTGPTPDPNFGAKEELRRIERKLQELDHREKETERFLRREHPNSYIPEDYKESTYQEEDVPARKTEKTIDSRDANPENFKLPIKGRGPAPTNIPEDEEERLKIPSKEDDKSSGKKAEGTTQFQESEPQVFRLENRITTKAVAPRERMQIVTRQSKLSVAKSSKNSGKVTESTVSAQTVRK